MPPLINKLNTELRKKLVKCFIWSIALYGSETYAPIQFEEKHLENFENVILEENGEDKMDSMFFASSFS